MAELETVSNIAGRTALTKHSLDTREFLFEMGPWLCGGPMTRLVSITDDSGGLVITNEAQRNETQVSAIISGGLDGSDHWLRVRAEFGTPTQTINRMFLLRVRDELPTDPSLGSANFDGVSGYLWTPGRPELFKSTGLTACGWVNPRSGEIPNGGFGLFSMGFGGANNNIAQHGWAVEFNEATPAPPPPIQ